MCLLWVCKANSAHFVYIMLFCTVYLTLYNACGHFCMVWRVLSCIYGGVTWVDSNETVFQMTGAKDRMREKKMKNQPRNVIYTSSGLMKASFGRCCSIWSYVVCVIGRMLIVYRSRYRGRSGVTGVRLGQRSSAWGSQLQSRSAQTHHR